ncbi:sigma-70 family RNA polymerase sigma factor [Pendulispora brunnea]|uniref:Sigma-70 family RNA polymerase sigma factor n=1 Tax=Pendulispora brunnea TaxID=2905690 RepID=A0ABZ2KDB2_9BACT
MAITDESLATPISVRSREVRRASMAEFEQIYRAEFRAVWAFLHRLGARSAALDDLTHDVFVTAYARFSTFDRTRPAKAWLRGIAWRLFADYRRLHYHRHEVDAERGEHVPISEPSPDERIAARQAREMIDEALDALDDDKRAVFVMYEFDGLSVPEIAAAMEAPAPTTSSRLRLAREAFTAALERVRRRRGLS